MIEGSFKTKTCRTELDKKSSIKWKHLQPHGFFRKINDLGEIEFFGCFIDGHLKGKCWKSLAGGKK